MKNEGIFPPGSCIVYQCYGNEGIYCECALSILSLAALHTADELASLEIHIYTDAPQWFQQLQCPLQPVFHTLTTDTLQAWRGTINFVHRVKIALLQDLLLSGARNILYVDTDVVFIQRIDTVLAQIAAGALYMHVMEGVISDCGNPIMTKLCHFLNQTKQQQPNGAPLSNIVLWNAGVLGFNAAHAPLLTDVMAYTDKVHPQFPKHIVEQFAFSMRFQQEGPVKTSAQYMIHYWNLKEARPVLLSFFNHYRSMGWHKMLQCAQLIQMHVLMQEKANFYSGRSIAGKLAKKVWQPVIPDWAKEEMQLF